MGITVYGRKAIRRVERATGERIVHMAGPWFTTVDHRHFEWAAGDWHPVPQGREVGCGLGVHLWSCGILFGHGPENGAYGHGFMRGPCVSGCGARDGELHTWDCPHLQYILEMHSINPDYWPRPVHRPMWLDDPRRSVSVYAKAAAQIALALDVPFDLMPPLRGDPVFPGPNHWSHWVRAEEP